MITAKLVGIINEIPVPTQFNYREADPYCVEVVFMPPGGEPIVWQFARDLLIDGLVNTVGEGDVKILPSWSHIVIMVCNGKKAAIFRFKRREIAGFVGQITEVVPRGRESEYFDLDTYLRGLVE